MPALQAEHETGRGEAPPPLTLIPSEFAGASPLLLTPRLLTINPTCSRFRDLSTFGRGFCRHSFPDPSFRQKQMDNPDGQSTCVYTSPLGRVGTTHRCAIPPSEPCVRVSSHTAQASRFASTVFPWLCICWWQYRCTSCKFDWSSDPPSSLGRR